MSRFPLHIKDAVATDNFVDIKSPFDGSVVGTIERPDEAALLKALEVAHEVFHSTMKSMPAHARADILYKVAAAIKENHEELSLLIAKEGGKPLKDARAEVSRAYNTTKMSGDVALTLDGETISMDRAPGTEHHLALTVREPVGPVLAISAFNHPVNLICHQVCTAIAAGNTVLVKPASQTALSCFRIAQLFAEAGLPEGVISVINAAGADTEVVVKDPRIAFVTFIGGEDVGWALREKVQPGVKLALEHGGTGTAIVMEDADFDRAIPSITRGAFYHAGQVCVSTQLVYVHQSRLDEFLKGFSSSVEALTTGDPSSPETDVGPLISKKDQDRVASWVKEAVDGGATIVCGGKPIDNQCHQPTILTGTKAEMSVRAKEIFGPVVVVEAYSDINEVISSLNESRYAFQSAVYTNSIDKAFSAARAIETKACMINDSTAFRVDWMPFGGFKASGLGVGGVKYSIEDMTEEKLIVAKIQP